MPAAIAVPQTNPPPIQRYLHKLIADLNGVLIGRPPRPLDSRETPDAIRSIRNQRERSYSPVVPRTGINHVPVAQQPKTFESFEDAFHTCGLQMLLLGDPGAGKSTTLHEVALKAAEDRLQDPSHPIPLLIPLDEVKEHRISQLPSGALAPLLQNHAADDGARIFQGQPLLYILDGLDEMGGGRPTSAYQSGGATFDPRSEFLQCLQQQLPNDELVVSCRNTDYNQIEQKVLLPGAVTLLPLSDEKIEAFLVEKQDQPHLWAKLETDQALLELARTPLLLALLSGAVGNSQEPINLTSAGKLIDFYIDRRYQHEAAKHPVPFTLEETRHLLGTIAAYMCRYHLNPLRSLTRSHVRSILGQIASAFHDFACRLHLLIAPTDGDTVEFPHLAFRDRFAVSFYIQALEGKNVATRWRASRLFEPSMVGTLLQACGVGYKEVRLSAAIALFNIGPAAADAIPALIKTLGDDQPSVRSNAADALGNIGSCAAEAVPALIKALGEDEWLVRCNAAYALGMVSPITAEAIRELIKALGDDDSNVRSSAAGALGNIGRVALNAVPALQHALTDNHKDVRKTAAKALQRIQSPDPT